jgi:hypothetical protein
LGGRFPDGSFHGAKSLQAGLLVVQMGLDFGFHCAEPGLHHQVVRLRGEKAGLLHTEQGIGILFGMGPGEAHPAPDECLEHRVIRLSRGLKGELVVLPGMLVLSHVIEQDPCEQHGPAD